MTRPNVSYVELRTNQGNTLRVSPLTESDIVKAAQLIAEIATQDELPPITPARPPEALGLMHQEPPGMPDG